MDGVMADFVGGAAAKIKEMFGYDVPSDSSQITEWSWFDKVLTKKEVNKFWNDVRYHAWFWYYLSPLVNAHEANYLNVLGYTHQVRYVTSRVGDHGAVRDVTYQWLKVVGVESPLVEVVGKDCHWESKAEIASVFKPIIAVEDAPKNIKDYMDLGVFTISPDYPYCLPAEADMISNRPIAAIKEALKAIEERKVLV